MIKLKFLFLLIFCCASLSTFAQELDWLKGSTSNDPYTSHGFYTSTQHNDVFYFAGDFWKDLTIDGENIEIGGDSGNGFIIAMDETGESSLLIHLASTDYVRINKIAVNPVTESLIATGRFRSDMTFNNQTWKAEFFSTGFVMSINTIDGTLDWMKELKPQTNVSSAIGTGLTVDEMGDIYVGIEAVGTIEIEDQSFTFQEETGAVVIAKLNGEGDLMSTDVWESKNFEGWIDINDMVIDTDNNLITVGTTSGVIEIADSSFVFSSQTLEPFIIKQDEDLTFQWLKTYNGLQSHILDVLVDKNNLVLSMQYREYIDVDGNVLVGSGSWGDMAILSIDENAKLNWVKNYTLTENAGIWGVYGKSIASWNGQYYIGGMYQGDVVHNGELILDNNQSGPSYQYPFIISMDSKGEFISAYDFLGSGGIGKIDCISANQSHLLFGGDFAGQVSIGDTSVSTLNTALFYGALKIDVTNTEATDDREAVFSVYPTLTTDYLAIETEVEISRFLLISTTGGLLGEYKGTSKSIDVSNLVAGNYFLVGESRGKLASVRFIKY